ncbi:T9SS type A sorting domain-containing protein [Chitinophagaceae bacterium MMS25-I14]
MKQVHAQTVLNTGDVSIIGFNSALSNRDGFAFVAWVDLATNTVIKFTDDGYNNNALANSASNIRDLEQLVTWTATAPVTAGTVITIEGNGVSPNMVANIGSVTVVNSDGTAATNMSLGNGGDQIFAFQGNSYVTGNSATGTMASNTVMLFGISYQGISSTFTNWLTTGPAGSATSCLPTDLASNNIFFGSSTVAGEYSGARTGLTIAQYKAAINDPNNWTKYINPNGVTTYNTTAISIGTPATITGQPSNASACSGNGTSFTVNANNPTGWTWEISTNGGTSYSTLTISGVYSVNSTTGATGSSTLTISNVAGLNGNMYRAIAAGTPSATSNAATLTINSAPSISGQPTAATACAGGNATFTVTASNATGYQWQENSGAGFGNITNGGIYSGATTPTLTLTGVTAGMNGYSYRCIATGSCTPNATSNGVTLTVNPAPSITSQPSASTICTGNNTTFSVTASNATGYQWQVDPGTGFTNLSNGAPYSGVSTATLTITGATAGLNGYSYRCIATGSCTPAATSNGVLLTVNSAPSISGQPSNATTCTNTSFTVSASNATGYQWQVNTGSGFNNITNGGVYSNATTATLNITGATAGMNGYTYQCIVSGACTPNATSNTATLTVQTPGTWTGNLNLAWSNSANWTCGTLPTATTDVIIPNVINLPIVNINSAICNNLTINSGGSLGFTGTTNVLTVKGNITNNGVLSGSGGKILLSGTTQTIPAVSCKDLEIAGGGLKTLAGSITLTGTLTLTNGYLQLGNNNLTLGNSAVVSGGSATSYVVTNGSGKLTNQNIGSTGKTGVVVFPVGSSSLSYTPAAITNAGTTDNFSVNVFDNIYSSYNNNVPTGTVQAIDAVAKTWIVSEATAGGSNATLSLQWNASDQLTGFDKNNCYLLHYSNTTNSFTLGTMGIATGSDPYSMSMTGITSFSPFGVGSIGSPLNVDLISFGLTGKSQKGRTDLQWVTANERNMASYVLERSNDGITYGQIANIKAVNQNTDNQHIYNYEDATADNAPQHYYRLKMMNLDGTYKYSNVVAVSNTELSIVSYEVFPNPVDGSDLFIKTSNNLPSGIKVDIIDMQGKTLLHSTPENWQSGVTSVNVKSLPSGIYLLHITGKTGELISTIRFTKK